MRRILILCLCLILLAPLALPSQIVTAQTDDSPTDLLVQITAAAGDGSSLRAVLDDLADSQNMQVVKVWPQFRTGLLEAKPALTGAALMPNAVDARRLALLADPAVAQAEVDAYVYAADRVGRAHDLFDQAVIWPNDPRLADQYALSRINAFAGWAISEGSPQVVVAVIDSGYDLDHEDISPTSVWVNQAEVAGVAGVDDDNNGYVDDIRGWDWIDNDGITNDPYGHGTHVGGVIAATTDNGIGVASLGRNLRVLPLRILDTYGRGSISGLLDALAYAADQGVRIINLSLVTTSDSATLHTAIQTVASQGALIVAAAGNAGAPVSNYFPAAWPEVFTIAATDGEDTVAYFSNYGPAIDVAAPGSAILSTYKDNSYYLSSGTSMATPHVSALAGLLLSLRPDLSLTQLTDLIRASADDANQIEFPGQDSYLGDGRIDVESALWMASQGLVLEPGGDNLLPAGDVGTILVSAVAGADALPVQGAVMTYTLRAQTDGALLKAGSLLTGPAATPISATTPSAPGNYILEVAIGQVTASLPVYSYVGPLQMTLSTQSELSAQDTVLSFVLEAVDAHGDPLPAPVRVLLHTNTGLFNNDASEIEVSVSDGSYVGTLHDWAITDLLAHDLQLDAQVITTGQTASAQVSLPVHRLYFPYMPDP